MESKIFIANVVKVHDLQSPSHVLYKHLISDLCTANISPIRTNIKLLPGKNGQ